jgi:hypothetical protein
MDMKNMIGLNIAGIEYLITCPDSAVLKGLEPNYMPFLQSAGHQGRGRRFVVRIVTDKMPDIGGLRKLFDTGQPWELYTDGGDYFLAFNTRGGNGRPLSLVRISYDFSSAEVFYDEGLIEKVGGAVSVPNPFCYPLDKILTMFVLSMEQGMLVHTACIDREGIGYIFPGRSEAGKSTISRLFASMGGAELISDERVAIRKHAEEFRVYGTPWAGDAGVVVNRDLPLSGIFFISKGAENRIREISRQEAIERLLPVTTVPWYDSRVFPRVLDACEGLVSLVPAFELSFLPDTGVVEFFEEFIYAEKP